MTLLICFTPIYAIKCKLTQGGACVDLIENNIRDIIPKLLTEKNINFLIGSGASTPFFPTLGNIENFITRKNLNSETIHLVYAMYFNKVIRKNIDLLINDNADQHKTDVLMNYVEFIHNLTMKMRLRNSRLSPNRANIFTTNYDLFFELAIDKTLQDNRHLFFNDGANGYFTRVLSSDNYHRTMSLNVVFDNYQKEIPMLNLIKCHGSVTWEKIQDDQIKINNNLKILDDILRAYKDLQITNLKEKQLEKFIINEDVLSLKNFSKSLINELRAFYEEYKRLLVVNPEKSKFEHTVLHEYYYSMLRLLSYELEKEQTILIVFGFSFADEHIGNLIKRSLNNPFLQVYIFGYNEQSEIEIKRKLGFKNNPSNVIFISPSNDEPVIDFLCFNNIIFGGNPLC